MTPSYLPLLEWSCTHLMSKLITTVAGLDSPYMADVTVTFRSGVSRTFLLSVEESTDLDRHLDMMMYDGLTNRVDSTTGKDVVGVYEFVEVHHDLGSNGYSYRPFMFRTGDVSMVTVDGLWKVEEQDGKLWRCPVGVLP